MLTLFVLAMTFFTTASANDLNTSNELFDRKSELNGKQKLIKPLLKQGDEVVDEMKVNYTQALRNFQAFEYGLDGDYFASNFSTCSIHSLTWWFFEVSTYKVKLRYASYDDAVTNTTLFIQNFTNLMIECSDVIENLYYYGLNEAERFASGTDWALGLL